MAENQPVKGEQNDEGKGGDCLSVELLIPVFHPGKELGELLGRMASQTRKPAQIHLLITADEAEYVSLQEKYRHAADPLPVRFTRIDPPSFDHGGTRRLGAEESSADLLLFMTQDAVPADDVLVERLADAFSGPAPEGCKSVGAAYARQLSRPDCGLIEEYTRQFNYPEEGRVQTKADLPVLGIKTYFCSNVCAMWRRSAYEEQGGFERSAIFNEDMILAARLVQAGCGIAYVPDAKVIHSHNYSGREQLHRNFDLAVSQAQHPEIFGGVPSEGEGIRMVKKTAAHLCRTGKIILVPKLVWQSGCKYLGYLLGKRYERLPQKAVAALTMNPGYWAAQKKNNDR